MKEEKRIWLNKIEANESSIVRKFRTGMFLKWLCTTYRKLFVLAVIVFFAVVFFRFWNGQADVFKLLVFDIRFFAFVQISLLVPTFVDCCIADRLIGQCLDLGAEVRHLKKFGWNGSPFCS